MNDRVDHDFIRQVINDELFALRTEHPDLIGIETEMLTVFVSPDEIPQPVAFLNPDGRGLRQVLHEIAISADWHDDFHDDGNLASQTLRLKLPQGDALTFEPGGQLEYSSRPYDNLKTARAQIESMQAKIRTALSTHGIDVFYLGINPWHTVEEIGLQITKPEYKILDTYFGRYAPVGRRMMRQTCTTQVSIDFGNDEHTLAQRYLVCNLIAPYAAAMFANSGVWELNQHTVEGFRTAIWRELDRTRTGFPDLRAIAQNLDKKSCVNAYFDFAMNAYSMLFNPRITFHDWLTAGMEGKYPTVADVQAHLYTLFPEVRPRRYLEIRSIDSQAPVWQFVPTAFYLGIVYHSPTMQRVLDVLSSEIGEQEKLMTVAQHGFATADEQFTNRAKWLMEVSISGMESLPTNFYDPQVYTRLVSFYEQFTLKNKTPSTDIQTIVKSSGKDYIEPRKLRELEEEWLTYG